MSFNRESRTQNASRNILTSLENRIILFLLTFISRKLFINYIGIEYLGINGLFANILTLLSMADLGISTALNVSLYKPIADHDEKKIAALIYFFSRIYLIISVAVGVIGISLVPFLKYLINLDQAVPNVTLYYILFVIKNICSYLVVYKSSLLYADQKSYIINKVDMIVGIVKLCAQIVFTIITKSYLLFLLVDIFSVIARNLVVSAKATKSYPFLNIKTRLGKREQKDVFTNVSSIFIYKISFALINGTDNILISIIVGTFYVGLYSNYLIITDGIEAVISILFNSLTASVGNLIAQEDEDTRYNIFKVMQMISFWLSACVVTFLFFLCKILFNCGSVNNTC